MPEVLYAAREAEEQLLAGLIVDGSTGEAGPIKVASGIVTPSDFLDYGYPDDQHARIFQAMVSASKSDNLSIAQQMNTDGTLKDGDIGYLSHLVSICGGIETEHYAKIVSDYADQRRNGKSPTDNGDPFAFGLTDYGNAERLVRLYGDVIRYSPERKSWLVWTGKVWAWDMGGVKIRKLAKNTARNIYREAADESGCLLYTSPSPRDRS